MVAALLVTLLAGWLWGASGRWELARALRTADVSRSLLEARAAVLGARVSLCDADFGEMTRRLEDARTFLGRAGERLDAGGMSAERERVDLAAFGAAISRATRLAELAVPSASPGAPGPTGPRPVGVHAIGSSRVP
jgi:hypothetical protein